MQRSGESRCLLNVISSTRIELTEAGGDAVSDLDEFDGRFLAARDRLFRICAGFVGADVADDIIHDTYVRARSRRRQLRDPALLEGWLTRIAINLCMNRNRSLRRWWALDTCRPGGGVNATRDTGLAEMIEHLPPRERTAIVLHYGHGYRLDEIARLSGLAPGTVRATIHRARQRLRRQLEAARR